jgi:hypothetical protein
MKGDRGQGAGFRLGHPARHDPAYRLCCRVVPFAFVIPTLARRSYTASTPRGDGGRAAAQLPFHFLRAGSNSKEQANQALSDG